MTPSRSALAVVNPRPLLAPVLRRERPTNSNADHQYRASLWPLMGLLAVAGFAALKADAGAEAWPLAVLAATPLIALLVGVIGAVRPGREPALRQRTCRIVRDRRPVLLRAVIRVPPGRPPRVISRAVRHCELFPPSKAARSSVSRRPARLIRPYLPK